MANHEPRRHSGQLRNSDQQRSSDQRRNAAGRQRNRGGDRQRQYSEATPAQRVREADAPRLVAYETLQAVSVDNAYANLVLPKKIRDNRLDKRDAGLATELTYGALRSTGTYDAIIAECVDRPLPKIEPGVLNALRIGAHQLLSMRIPPHAAVNQTVALTRAVLGAGAGSFVNAILRRISERPMETWLQELGAALTDPVAQMALRESHPEWIIRAFRQALVAHGRKPEEIGEVLEADNAAPVVNLVALPELGSLDEALDAGYSRGDLAPGSALSAGGDLGRLQSVREGSVRVQDAGSQLVARAMAQVPLEHDGGAWLDLCAGPGGKAALLAALAAQRGAKLTANEPAEHRATLVKQALSPVPEKAWTVRVGDGRDAGTEGFTGFDRILIDAPCSGLGALRRRPEARWRRTLSEVAELSTLQRQLLTAGIAALKPGGVLAYVTCSPHPAETTAVVTDALKAHPELSLLDAGKALDAVALQPLNAGNPTPPLPRQYQGKPGGTTAQLWPDVHHTDAMFLALFAKN